MKLAIGRRPSAVSAEAESEILGEVESFGEEIVVEVAETRSSRVANVYLAAGWVLLSVSSVDFNAVHREGSREGQRYIRRGHEYVLGRLPGVAAMTREEAQSAAWGEGE